MKFQETRIPGACIIDITPIPEPLWSKNKDKYRAVVLASELLPPLDNVVGVTTGKAAASRGDFIRAVIRARRQAVDYMYANPDESGDIIAKQAEKETLAWVLPEEGGMLWTDFDSDLGIETDFAFYVRWDVSITRNLFGKGFVTAVAGIVLQPWRLAT